MSDGSARIAFGALLWDLGGSSGDRAAYWQSGVYDLNGSAMPHMRRSAQ